MRRLRVLRSGLCVADKACIRQDNITANLECLPVFLAGCQRLLVVAGPTYFERLWCIMEIFVFLRMGGDSRRITVVPISKDDEDGEVDPRFSVGDSVKSQQCANQVAISQSSRKQSSRSRTRLSSLTRTCSSTLRRFVKTAFYLKESSQRENPQSLTQERSRRISRTAAEEKCLWHSLMVVRFEDFETEKCKCFLESDKQRLFAIIESSFGSLRKFDAVVRGTILR